MVMDASEPFPFEDEVFDEVLASHVLEHISDWPSTVMECHRVLKPNGILRVHVPYGIGKRNSDAFHVRFFWEGSMNIFENVESRGLDAKSVNGVFEVVERVILRKMWYAWHIRKYLRLDLTETLYRFPFGFKKDIHWTMRKIGGNGHD